MSNEFGRMGPQMVCTGWEAKRSEMSHPTEKRDEISSPWETARRLSAQELLPAEDVILIRKTIWSPSETISDADNSQRNGAA